MRAARRAAAALTVAALTACAAPGTRPASGPPPTEPAGTASTAPATIPDVTGENVSAARKLLSGAKLTPIVRYAPEILVTPGSVMLTMPKAGATATVGDVVILVVAGRPDVGYDGTPGAKALADLAAAREEYFVGVGFPDADPGKPIVVALAPGVDESAWQERIAAAAGTQKYAVRECANTLAELEQIQAEVVESAHGAAIAPAVRPAECAVHVSGNVPTELAADLRARYGSTVVIQQPGR